MMKKAIAFLTSLALTVGVLCATLVGVGAVAAGTVTTFEDLYVGEYSTDNHSGLAHIVFGTVSDVDAEYGVIVEDSAGAKFLFEGKAISEDGKFGIALYEMPDGDYVAYAYTGSGNDRVLGNGVTFTVGGELYLRNGNEVIMGEQPGKVVTDTALIAALDAINADANGKYVYDGKAYVAYVATPYDDYVFDNGNAIEAGKKYYFALEAMNWLVVEETETTLTVVAEDIVMAAPFDADFAEVTYADSDIKAVVEGLKAVCLSQEQQEITSEFALPIMDVIGALDSRAAIMSDYARATGAYAEDLVGYEGNGEYWLDAEGAPEGYAAYVGVDGVYSYAVAQVTYIGIRPVVTITK